MNNQLKYLLRKITLGYYSFRFSAYFSYATPLLLLIVGVFIFWLFIIPQLYSWFSIQNEIDSTNRKINIIRQNIAYVENLNKFLVDKDYLTSLNALPGDKDYIGILNSINKASSKSNIILNDYEFNLGQITIDKQSKQKLSSPTSIFIGLSVEGNIENVSRFLFEIEHNLPLAEIKSLNYADGKGEILLTFYLKQLPDIQFIYNKPVTPLNQEQHSVLQSLHQWSGQ